ncbi:MAG: GH25 family lysozyme [Prevotella sp.]|nr:glycosyl hydrolase family 25 [Bacteroidales bacterium]MDY4228675.1 GH25 family lysozyme [Prevotella sp.]
MGPLIVAAIVVVTLAFIAMPATVFYAVGNFFGMWTGEGDTFDNDNLVHGIDVSRYQGEIDWPTVAQENVISFVYIKATEGSSHIDSRFRENFRGAREVGLRVGAYHFLSWKSPVRSQFENYKRHVPKSEIDLLPMVDVEKSGVGGWSAEQINDSLQVFCDLVKDHYGKRPVIYTYSHFYNTYLYERFHNYYLFIANYNHYPNIKGVGQHNIWQKSERGRMNGIKGFVDLDVLSNGTTLEDISM